MQKENRFTFLEAIFDYAMNCLAELNKARRSLKKSILKKQIFISNVLCFKTKQIAR